MLLVEWSYSLLRHWLSAEVIIVFFVADQRADMAIADLSISYQRELVVDFTMPFLDLGEAGLFYALYNNNGTPSPIYRLLDGVTHPWWKSTHISEPKILLIGANCNRLLPRTSNATKRWGSSTETKLSTMCGIKWLIVYWVLVLFAYKYDFF